MPASAIEAEATGREFVTATFGGREWTVPLDVDTWPVDLVSATVTVTEDGRVEIDYGKLTTALQYLLGEQWDAFITAAPKRRDLLPASQQIATAVGFDARDRVDVAFGAVPRFLRDVERWPGPVESTLRAQGIDYRDRYLHTAGRPRLTLRQIHVALEYAPYDSPLAIARNGGRRPLSDTALAVMDLYEAITRTPHHLRLRTFSPNERSERANASQKEAEAVADYRRRHQSSAPASERRRTAAETARANAQFARQREAAAHGS